ncbi:glycosyltransferase family 4 protein [Croceibacterium xixiisoli]|uniref:glycosyltransferase family 4 protein n=1 Tax=Croceibacterium xixiisoli TaxID=1476466 RepID=UPI00361B2E7C
MQRPYLFDATRLISRSWTRRYSTGIDRVCYAYLDNFRVRAQAAVQVRGLLRILTPAHSDELFDMLRGPDTAFRRKLAAFAPRALTCGASQIDGDGAFYINVSHTDFDLARHTQWVERNRVRPLYLIHDLIPITHAQYCTERATARHRGRVVNALRNAAGIIVNSEATEQELARFSARENLRQPPVLAASLAGADLPKSSAPIAGAPAYFVCAGTIESRKNHILLLQLWLRLIGQLGDRTPQLVIIGQWGANSEPVRAMLQGSAALRRHVTVLNRCSDAELGKWIAGARALLMPTLAEGFGLPLVEAFKLGTPVIASDLPCFRETGQGVPILLDPFDIEAWFGMIRSFDSHPERARQMMSMATYRAPTWEQHFSAVEAWCASLPPLSFAKQDARSRANHLRGRAPLRPETGLSNALVE